MATTKINASRYERAWANLLSFGIRFAPISSRRGRCLLINKDKVLLVVNRVNTGGLVWALPGGGCRPNEKIEVCIQREINEELRINIKDENIYKLFLKTKKHGLYKIKYEVFLANIDSVEFHSDPKELIDAQWFEIDDLPIPRKELIDQAIASANFKS